MLSLNDSYTKKYLNLRAKNIFKPKKKIVKVMQSQAKIIKEKMIAKKDFILYFDNTHIYATRQYAFILAKGIASHCVFTIKFSSRKYMCTRSVV